MGGIISGSEKVDFYSLIKRHGFQEKNFELTQQRDQTSDTGIYAITGTVTIRCPRVGKEKTYKAGHCSSWLAQFNDDLASGVFGTPSN